MAIWMPDLQPGLGLWKGNLKIMVLIAPQLDLGNGRTLEMYWEAINGLRAKQQKYNALLSSVDNFYNRLNRN